MTEGDWRNRADCQGLDPNWWFPTQGQPTEHARQICRGCPVRLACLSAALADPTLSGIWGGTTGRERQRIRLTRDVSA